MSRTPLTGTRIRERRAQLGLKQAELARAVGVSPAYLNLIEHNRRPVTERMLSALAWALETQPSVLAEGGEPLLYEALREAAAEPGPGTDPPAELDRVEEFATRYPGWAVRLARRQERVVALERAIEGLTERLAHDPQLSASLHEVLSSVTSVRSTAAILAETEDIDPDWRARFHANLRDDSERLAHAAEALVAYLDAGSERDAGPAAPLDELESWLAAQGWHLPALEAAETPDLDRIVATAPELASAASRDLARAFLDRARADAQALPLPALAAARAELGDDPGRIAARFGTGPIAVFRRLALLPPDPGRPAPGLILCDAAGAPVFRRLPEGFALPRFGAPCALWPLYRALTRPGLPVAAVMEVAGRVPRRFRSWAYAETAHPAGFDGPEVVTAGMLLQPAEAARAPGEIEAGSTCRICPRAACPARREPSLLEAG